MSPETLEAAGGDLGRGIDALAAIKVAVALGLGTLLLRIACAELRRRFTIPGRLESALDWLPVAALAAMVTPAFAPTPGGSFEVATLGAAAITALVGYKTRNLVLSVGAGLLAWWLLPA